MKRIISLQPGQGKTEDVALILMEKMDQNLNDVMKIYADSMKPWAVKPPWFDRLSRLDAIIQLVETVEFIEEQGYLHGDLRPANVMVQHLHTGSMQLLFKIIDWDSVVSIADDPGDLELIPTTGYVAPGQFPKVCTMVGGEDAYTPQHLEYDDVCEKLESFGPYSLGVILLKLAAWKLCNTEDLVRLASEPRSPEDVRRFLEDEMWLDTKKHSEFFDIVIGALCWETNRYTTTELLQELSAFPKHADDLPWIT